MSIVFIGICKNASSSLWKLLHSKGDGLYSTPYAQHATVMDRKDEIEQASKIIIVTRDPYARWKSMYTFLQYQKQWKNVDPDLVLDRIRQAQLQNRLNPKSIGRTDLDIIFCPQWTWLGHTIQEAKERIRDPRLVILDFDHLSRDLQTNVSELKTLRVGHHNRTSDQFKSTYDTMTAHQRQMVRSIWKEDFELFGWTP